MKTYLEKNGRKMIIYITTKCEITGQDESGRIQFLMNNKVLGECVLHNASMGLSRRNYAKKLGIKQYNRIILFNCINNKVTITDSNKIKPKSIFKEEFLPIN